MDFDARHGGIDRRGLQIEQPGRRGADQHQPLGKAVGRHTSLDHVDGGDVAGRVMRGEMHPKLAVAIGRQFQPGHRHAFDAGLRPT